MTTVACRERVGVRAGRAFRSRACTNDAKFRITSETYVQTKGAMGSTFVACGVHAKKYKPAPALPNGWIVEPL